MWGRAGVCTSRGRRIQRPKPLVRRSPRVASPPLRHGYGVERERRTGRDGYRILRRPITHRCACLSGTPVAHHPVRPRLVAVLRSPVTGCDVPTCDKRRMWNPSPPCVPLNPRFFTINQANFSCSTCNCSRKLSFFLFLFFVSEPVAARTLSAGPSGLRCESLGARSLLPFRDPDGRRRPSTPPAPLDFLGRCS